MADKRLYWLKVPAPFFDDKVIKKLRSIPGGETYTIIALKILLKALSNDYRIYFDGVEDTFAEEIALELGESSEAVEITVRYLIGKGWLKQEKDDVLYSVKTEELSGSESSYAGKKREYRAKLKSCKEKELLESEEDIVLTMSEQCPTEIEIEKEKEYIESSLRSDSFPAPLGKQGVQDETKDTEDGIEFPVVGKSGDPNSKSVTIPNSWIAEMQELYGESIDVVAEVKKAKAWCLNNTRKSNWKKFLGRWLARANDDSAHRKAGPRQTQTQRGRQSGLDDSAYRGAVEEETL